MYNKLFALIALIAILCGVALARDFSANIKLKVFEDSSEHWLAVDPLADNDATVKMEMLEADSNEWVEMKHNVESGHWQMWSDSPKGFVLPVSFRLTTKDGEQVILDNVMTQNVGAGMELETAVQFQKHARQSNEEGRHEERPNEHTTPAPTHHAGRPTERPEQPTQHPTQQPTQQPTQHSNQPTQAPTQHSSRPTSAPSAPTQQPSTGASSGSSSTDLCAVTPTSQEPVKILVPLYQDPDSDWDTLIASANAGTSIIAIINPNNGPVSSGPDSSYVTYINKMNEAGIDLVGYVHTSYGDRSISDVESDINTYATLYSGLKGIFLDEVSADASEIPYYQQAYTYIMSQSGYVHDILNPGAATDQGYQAASTSIVIYEDEANGYTSPTDSWVMCAPSASEKAGYKYKFSAIAYGASQSQMTSLASEMANAGIGMVYITDLDLPNPYDPLPSYWSTEATTVKDL